MVRRVLLAAMLIALGAAPVAAQQAPAGTPRVERAVSRVQNPDGSWTETVTERWTEEAGSERAIGFAAAPVTGIIRFGAFVVLDGARAALVATTDGASPRDFAAMLRAFPAIRTLEMADCPGTVDDVANLRLGRMIRAHGIDTEVPPGGSVRSGAVELFFAGAHRHAAADAEFDVHSWIDTAGQQARDVRADDPVNRAYLEYYREMGLAPERAAAFYALTNSVPNEGVLALHTRDIARYAAVD